MDRCQVVADLPRGRGAYNNLEDAVGGAGAARGGRQRLQRHDGHACKPGHASLETSRAATRAASPVAPHQNKDLNPLKRHVRRPCPTHGLHAPAACGPRNAFVARCAVNCQPRCPPRRRCRALLLSAPRWPSPRRRPKDESEVGAEVCFREAPRPMCAIARAHRPPSRGKTQPPTRATNGRLGHPATHCADRPVLHRRGRPEGHLGPLGTEFYYSRCTGTIRCGESESAIHGHTCGGWRVWSKRWGKALGRGGSKGQLAARHDTTTD